MSMCMCMCTFILTCTCVHTCTCPHVHIYLYNVTTFPVAVPPARLDGPAGEVVRPVGRGLPHSTRDRGDWAGYNGQPAERSRDHRQNERQSEWHPVFVASLLFTYNLRVQWNPSLWSPLNNSHLQYNDQQPWSQLNYIGTPLQQPPRIRITAKMPFPNSCRFRGVPLYSCY